MKLEDFLDQKPGRRKLNEDVIMCRKCSSTWFEQVYVQQFKESHNVILGQRIPAYQDFGFYVLRCVKCADILEPNVQAGPKDSYHTAYDDFLDHMEKDLEVKPKVTNNTVSERPQYRQQKEGQLERKRPPGHYPEFV